MGAFKNQESLRHDPIALNHLLEDSNWTSDIRHVQGAENRVADALSRPDRPPLGANDAPPSTTFSSPSAKHVLLDTAACNILETVDHKELALAQQTDIDVLAHRAGKHVTGLNLTDVEFSPGIFLLCDLSQGKKAQPIVLKSHRKAIIKWYHDLLHPGSKESVRKVAQRYYLPEMRSDIATYVSQCVPCNVAKPHKTTAWHPNSIGIPSSLRTKQSVSPNPVRLHSTEAVVT